jgi:transposase-like protein
MKNQIQFQQGYSLTRFLLNYGTEEQCRTALFQWRWPDGYICPECGGRKHCHLPSRKGLLQCNRCHHQQSVTSGTIFDSTKLPLRTWFLAIYLITQSKTGIAALALRRYLDVSYNTAWSLKQKIMQVMKERDDRRPLSGVIQVDDVYWGGRRSGGKSGRGSPNKTPFVAAVSANADGHPIYMNMNRVQGFTSAEIRRWSCRHLVSGSMVFSDGLACFNAVTDAGCQHQTVITGGGPDSVKHPEFTWVNTMIGNVKNAITGVYHAIDHKHLPRYLAEYCYRFNRRFDLAEMLPRFMSVAVRTPPMPYRLLKLAELYG